MLGNYLQQTTSADDIFRCIFSWRFKGQCTTLVSGCVAENVQSYMKLEVYTFTQLHAQIQKVLIEGVQFDNVLFLS